jgi:hypothetical protein
MIKINITNTMIKPNTTMIKIGTILKTNTTISWN